MRNRIIKSGLFATHTFCFFGGMRDQAAHNTFSDRTDIVKEAASFTFTTLTLGTLMVSVPAAYVLGYLKPAFVLGGVLSGLTTSHTLVGYTGAYCALRNR